MNRKGISAMSDASPVVDPTDAAATRRLRMNGFQVEAGWGDAQRLLLAGDASFRKYWRLVRPTGSAVLMDAPPPQEDVRPFVAVARHLSGLELSAPKILAQDVENGFLLLEDLGDGTYTRLLREGQDESALYALATDVLAHLARQPVPDGLSLEEAAPAQDEASAPSADDQSWPLPPYDDARLLAEAALLPDWFLPAVGAPLTAEARQAWDTVWQALLPQARRVGSAMVLRDFHVDNLMILPGRKDLAACGLLDFQDAVSGPLTYDLMSLLEDARRDIAPALKSAMQQRFLAACPEVQPEDFYASWAVMAAQRHAKVIGIFTRLFKRDGKPQYLCHLPRVWRLLEDACRQPVCAPLADWMQTYVPAELRQRCPQ